MGTSGNRIIRIIRSIRIIRIIQSRAHSPTSRHRRRLIAAVIALSLLALCGAWLGLGLTGPAQAARLDGATAATASCTPTPGFGTQPTPSPTRATTATSQGVGGNTGAMPCSTTPPPHTTPTAQRAGSVTPCATASPSGRPTATPTFVPQTKPTPKPTNTPIRFPTTLPTIAPPKGPLPTNGQVSGLLRNHYNQYNAVAPDCVGVAPPSSFNSASLIYALMIVTGVLLACMLGAFTITLSRRPRFQTVGQ